MLRTVFSTGGALFPDAAAAAAERLFYTPRRHATPDRERAWRRASEPLSIETRHGRLAARVWGDDADVLPWDPDARGAPARPTVLLVHGWEGRGTQMGAFAAPLAAAGFRVVAYDGPAHGASPGDRTDLPTWVDCVVDAAAQVGPLHAIVGHSMGGAATVLALAQGARASRAVLLAPPASVEDVLAKFGDVIGLPAPARAAFRRRFVAKWGPDVFDRLSADRVASRLGARALIVHDDADREVDGDAGARVAAAWPGARLLTTHGLGHRRVLRDDAVVDEVVRFVAGVDGAALRAA